MLILWHFFKSRVLVILNIQSLHKGTAQPATFYFSDSDVVFNHGGFVPLVLYGQGGGIRILTMPGGVHRACRCPLSPCCVSTGLGKTKRKTSARDASPTPSTDAEYPANGGGADRIYDLNIPAFVKFAYVAEREDELSLVKGSRVTVMEKCSDGWWRGSYNGQIGWFPSNYVLEEVDEAAAESPSFLSLRKGASLSNGQGARVLHVVQTLYPFSSVTEEELNFEKGETMEVIEKPENDPEWWKCKNARGQIGLVPKNYVVVLSDGPALPPSHAPQISYPGPAGSGRFAGREWYYGNVTRHQAECALNERGREGDFLIRDSESSVSALGWRGLPGAKEVPDNNSKRV